MLRELAHALTSPKNLMTKRSYWPLPEDLSVLHDAVIQYSVDVQTAAAAKHERQPDYPLSHGALFTLHWRAVVIHHAIRTLCVTGWTPVVPVLIRTLLDIMASCYAVVAKPEDAEYMGFKYMASFLVQALREGDLPPKVLEHDKEQLERLRAQTRGNDVDRVEQFIKDYKPQLYWYKPEFENPGAILKNASTDLYSIYGIFSSAVHGGFIGSSLFDDTPDVADINPQDHPRRTRMAIVMSSRLILEISYLRDRVEAAWSVAVSPVTIPLIGAGGLRLPGRKTSYRVLRLRLILCDSCWGGQTRYSLHPWWRTAIRLGYTEFFDAEGLKKLEPAR